MKLEKLVGGRFKERPADCATDNHMLLVRGGYIKFMASGIYSSYTPLKRITNKIEQIIREEMDAIDGQEVMFPVVMPASLWQESGRYESVGSELLRFTDRNNTAMVLGMTHEEASVHLVREYANSYAKYPFMIYQIQTKFRDEPRARGGLIRVREFTMKDAYSFHTSHEDLEEYYARCHAAYDRIYKRAGLKNFISVAGDSGMMGGKVSHEFMFLTPIGEDHLATCAECGFGANLEAAKSIVHNTMDAVSEELKEVYTPDCKTIDDVCAYLKADLKKSCKAVVYQRNVDDSYVVVFVRGDLDVNETKVQNYLKSEIHPAEITKESEIVAGFIGPVGIAKDVTVLLDESLKGTNNMVCGANKTDYHYTGFMPERDIVDAEFEDFANVFEGGICPQCQKESLTLTRGVEIGNIFQLGDKYTKTMGMSYLDQDGKAQVPTMGCYGIGVGRLAACICEEHHDDYGPIWPISIAPWEVHICAIKSTDARVREVADVLYRDLQHAGVQVIYDDRKVSTGVMFSDADLLGVPVRVTVSPRNLERQELEISTRDKSICMNVPVEEGVSAIQELISTLVQKEDSIHS